MQIDNKPQRSNEITLTKLKDVFFYSFGYNLVLLFAVVACWIGYIILATPTYQIKSLIQFESNKSENVLDIGFASPLYMNNLDDQTRIYKSRSNGVTLIRELGLNNNFVDLEENELSKDFLEDFRFELKSEFLGSKKFTIEFNQSTYNIIDEIGVQIIENVKYEEYVDNSRYTAFVPIPPKNLFEYERLSFESYNPNFSVRSYLSKFSINNFVSRLNSRNTLMEISYLTADPYLGMQIVDSMNSIYLTRSADKKKESAKSSKLFLEGRLSQVLSSYNIAQDNLKRFREINLFF